MTHIIFHSHSTTDDNEAGFASGHNDVELSLKGIAEAKQLGLKYKGQKFDAIFCSDLQRSYKTSKVAFNKRFPIIQDKRLRECDYGEFTHVPKQQMKAERINRITLPFPNGESYIQVLSRIKSFLKDISKDYDNKTILIIGHAGARIGLEYWLNQISVEDALTTIKKDEAGIKYRLSELYPLRVDSRPIY